MTMVGEAKKCSTLLADDVVEQAKAANANIHQLVEKTSVDPFGATTRSYMDKLITASAIGVVIGTVGNIKPDAALGPLTLNLTATKFIPFFVVLAILLYAASLISLAMADIRKWRVIYKANAATNQPLAQGILAAMELNRTLLADQGEMYERQNLDGEDVGELDKDGVPLAVKQAAAAATERHYVLRKELEKLIRPATTMRTQFAVQVSIFVILPVVFGALAAAIALYPLLTGAVG